MIAQNNYIFDVSLIVYFVQTWKVKKRNNAAFPQCRSKRISTFIRLFVTTHIYLSTLISISSCTLNSKFLYIVIFVGLKSTYSWNILCCLEAVRTQCYLSAEFICTIFNYKSINTLCLCQLPYTRVRLQLIATRIFDKLEDDRRCFAINYGK